jgi:hypothetical protein
LGVRLRRDFTVILNLVKAHALLHQVHRERDQVGRVIASLADYTAVHELVADLVSDGVEATVSPLVRQTVEAVQEIVMRNISATVEAVSKKLKLDKSAGWRRVQTAIKQGYLINRETRVGQPARLVEGQPLPDDVELLPHPDRLRECAVADGSISSPYPTSQAGTTGTEQTTAPEVAAGANERPAPPEEPTHRRLHDFTVRDEDMPPFPYPNRDMPAESNRKLVGGARNDGQRLASREGVDAEADDGIEVRLRQIGMRRCLRCQRARPLIALNDHGACRDEFECAKLAEASIRTTEPAPSPSTAPPLAPPAVGKRTVLEL